MSSLTRDDRGRINSVIGDRSQVFYWQTDRNISIEEAGSIWKDRHGYFTDHEIISTINSFWKDDQLHSIVPLDPKAQTNLGNVNSVRVANTVKGREVIIRLHPKGIKNGYFYAESAAAAVAKKHGLSSYETYFIHDLSADGDFAFQICEKLPGYTIQTWLKAHPDDESTIIQNAGKEMARLHTISTHQFGPFNNHYAETGELIGLHRSEREAVCTALQANLSWLTEEKIFTDTISKKILALFSSSPLLHCAAPVLIHNDFADWNLLTDGRIITGIIDWDECVSGDPMWDIACWSTFFDPKRLSMFLQGYFSDRSKPAHFDEKFELLRFRYTISKMTLRTRRYRWEQSEMIKEKIYVGREHLMLSLKYFQIN